MTVKQAQQLIAGYRNAIVSGRITRADQADLKILDKLCVDIEALIPGAVLPEDADVTGRIASAPEVLSRIKEPNLAGVGE